MPVHEVITIPCCLKITTPHSPSEQIRLRLSVLGETVFDDYEQSMTDDQRALVGQIASAHARLLGKYGAKLLGRDGA